MARYILRRVLHAVLLVLVTLVITFVVLQAAPGDAVTRYADPGVDAAVLDRTRARLGLDAPVHVQFLRWARGFTTGDFGTSLVYHRPVADVLRETIPRTLLLTALAFAVQLALGAGVGTMAAARRGRASERLTAVVVYIGYALPTFYLAYLLITVFSLHLDWLPTSGVATIGVEDAGTRAVFVDRVRHLILPVSVLALTGAAGWARFTRGALLDVLSEDHIVAARARGLGEGRVLFVHALRGALPQLVTLVGVSLPYLLGGAVVVEKVFAWPGMGSLIVDSIYARDYPVVLAVNFLAAVMVIAANLAVDVSYGFLDPRTKLASAGAEGRGG
jgi:peptide/nickel transport system permease protein